MGPQHSFPACREALNRVWYRANPEPNVVQRRQVLRQPGYPEYSGPVPARRRVSLTGDKHSGLQAPLHAALLLHAVVAFRPTIARGLAFSAIDLKFFPVYIRSNFSAKKDQVFQSFDF